MVRNPSDIRIEVRQEACWVSTSPLPNLRKAFTRWLLTRRHYSESPTQVGKVTQCIIWPHDVHLLRLLHQQAANTALITSGNPHSRLLPLSFGGLHLTYESLWISEVLVHKGGSSLSFALCPTGRGWTEPASGLASSLAVDSVCRIERRIAPHRSFSPVRRSASVYLSSSCILVHCLATALVRAHMVAGCTGRALHSGVVERVVPKLLLFVDIHRPKCQCMPRSSCPRGRAGPWGRGPIDIHSFVYGSYCTYCTMALFPVIVRGPCAARGPHIYKFRVVAVYAQLHDIEQRLSACSCVEVYV